MLKLRPEIRIGITSSLWMYLRLRRMCDWRPRVCSDLRGMSRAQWQQQEEGQWPNFTATVGKKISLQSLNSLNVEENLCILFILVLTLGQDFLLLLLRAVTWLNFISKLCFAITSMISKPISCQVQCIFGNGLLASELCKWCGTLPL